MMGRVNGVHDHNCWQRRLTCSRMVSKSWSSTSSFPPFLVTFSSFFANFFSALAFLAAFDATFTFFLGMVVEDGCAAVPLRGGA
ncbi:hypothetical protein CALCODRAFT_262620 [Calocera cornea HHB12733]|uniref:Uncharacterized protein n=1 Tax=Calocera cornea HHB12733 TaxID=1353952 RepID=A0A165GFK7_9BASI|nr:hypothetical protein CALCODRAFT_262620 [Calocera cornea HHB12733]